MKKILLLIITFLILPSFVFAESFTIKTHVKLDEGTLKGNEFTFVLKDSTGKVIQTKSNDKDGNITFDPIEFDKDSIDRANYTRKNGSTTYEDFELRIYTIEEKIDGRYPYNRSRKIWVKTVLFNDGTSKVYYLEDPDIESLLKNIPHYEYNPYHASDSDLEGEAYSVIDLSTGEARIFRDEPGKYTTGMSGSLFYTTGIEHSGYDSSYLFYSYKDAIRSIVFEDSYKPDTCKYMFESMPNLSSLDVSKLDTSNCTSFRGMFRNDYFLQEIDVTTFDISKVTDYNSMFDHCVSAKTIKIPSRWDFAGIDPYDVNNMFSYTSKLEYIDLSFLKNLTSASNIYMFNQSGLRVADFSSMNLNTSKDKVYQLWEGLFDYTKNMYYINFNGINNDFDNPSELDLDFYTDTVRVVDVGDKFCAGDDMSIFLYDAPRYNKYSYSINHNVFDVVLSDSTMVYDADHYAPSGRHLFINDEAEVTLLKTLVPIVEEPEEPVKPVTNPKTGVESYIIESIVLISVLYIAYSIIKKKNLFKNI